MAFARRSGACWHGTISRCDRDLQPPATPANAKSFRTGRAAMSDFSGRNILIVGGAGFVGSNLAKLILAQRPRRLTIVDNLLSADRINVPKDPAVRFVVGTITDDVILANLDNDLDYAFHLACYHGNQSSIRNPLADHDNNTLTSLKLFERLKDIGSLQKVVYAAAGCAVAEKTYDQAQATKEDAPVSLFHDSPYSISKLVGRDVRQLLFHAVQDAVRAGALPERLWAGRDTGRWTVARHGAYSVAQRDADVRLEGVARPRTASGKWRHCLPRLYLRRRHRGGLAACALRGQAWRSIQSRYRR